MSNKQATLHTIILLYNHNKLFKTVLTWQKGCWAGPVRGDHSSHESFGLTGPWRKTPGGLEEANINWYGCQMWNSQFKKTRQGQEMFWLDPHVNCNHYSGNSVYKMMVILATVISMLADVNITGCCSAARSADVSLTGSINHSHYQIQ